MTIEMSLLLAVLGGFVGLAGFFANRDKKTEDNAKWRGGVDAKLDVIIGLKSDVARMDSEIKAQGVKLAEVDTSTKQAHKRIDKIEKE